MFCEPCFAIVAVDETVHWFVCPVNLNLDKSCLVAATLFTHEETFIFVTLSFNFLIIPVSPLLPHAVHLLDFSFLLALVAGNFSGI